MIDKKVELPTGQILVKIIAELLSDRLYNVSSESEERMEEIRREELDADEALKDLKGPNEWGQTFQDKASWDHKDWKYNSVDMAYQRGRKDYAEELMEDLYRFLTKIGIEE